VIDADAFLLRGGEGSRWPGDIAALGYTGGTTGKSKGALCTTPWWRGSEGREAQVIAELADKSEVLDFDTVRIHAMCR
jgi:hypothetical protein